MNINKKEEFDLPISDLLHYFNRFKEINVLVIGDVILDQYIWGSVDRISQEAPIPVLLQERIENRLGGAGNVVANLIGIDARVLFTSVVGDDINSEKLNQLINSSNIIKSKLIVEKGRITTCKTRVTTNSQQIVRIDNEQTNKVNKDTTQELLSFIRDNLNQVDLILFSDYAKGVFSPFLIKEIVKLKKEKENLIIGCDSKPMNFPFIKGVDFIKPNKIEAEAILAHKINSTSDAMESAKLIKDLCECRIVALSLGALGLVIVSDGVEIHLPTVAKTVFDVSGAGDCVFAVFGLCLAAGINLQHSGQLVNLAAGYLVGEYGTTAINLTKLIKAVSTYN